MSESPAYADKSVIGIVLDAEQSSVLLVKRRDVPVWVLPGGGIDPQESPEQAVVREVLEETGFSVAISRQVAEYSPLNRLAKVTYVYACSVLEGHSALGPESKEVGFFPLDHLPQEFFHIHKEWLDDCLKNEPFVIRHPIYSVTYLNLFKYLIKRPLWVVRIFFSRMGFPFNN